MELAWKTPKDYLQHEGQVIEPITPRPVVKEAFAAQILDDGQVRIDMLDHRSLHAHTYDAEIFNHVVLAIEARYLDAVEKLREWFAERQAAGARSTVWSRRSSKSCPCPTASMSWHWPRSSMRLCWSMSSE